MKKRILSILITMTFTVSLFGLVGCSKGNNQQDNVQVIEEDESDSNINQEGTDDEEEVEDEVEVVEEEADITFTKEQLQENVEPNFSTPWVESPNGKFSACIEGRGPEGEEEGIGYIIVKDNETNEKWSYTIVEDGRQLSTKKIVWLDDDNIATIVGLSYGTIALGGNVYKLNLSTASTTFIYDTESERIQVINAEHVDNTIELEITVYEDDNFIEYHNESVTIELN